MQVLFLYPLRHPRDALSSVAVRGTYLTLVLFFGLLSPTASRLGLPSSAHGLIQASAASLGNRPSSEVDGYVLWGGGRGKEERQGPSFFSSHCVVRSSSWGCCTGPNYYHCTQGQRQICFSASGFPFLPSNATTFGWMCLHSSWPCAATLSHITQRAHTPQGQSDILPSILFTYAMST